MNGITRRTLCVAGALTAIKSAQAQALPGASADFPADADIQKILDNRLAMLRGTAGGAGIVLSVIGPSGRRIIASGRLSKQDPRSVTGDTVFEIGSVTKVFTALLLARMLREREIVLSDPVANYLPRGIVLSTRKGQAITLIDLATHTSGLPFMPIEPRMPDGAALPRVSASDLYGALARYELTRDIGAMWEYSSLGYWLLGQALAARAAARFEDLLTSQVIAPLHLKNTAFALSPAMHSQRATGHDSAMQPAPLLSSMPLYAAMPAAGGLCSTANDLLDLLAIAIGYKRSRLAAPMAAMLDTQRPQARAFINR